jgi:hypothetical protein
MLRNNERLAIVSRRLLRRREMYAPRGARRGRMLWPDGKLVADSATSSRLLDWNMLTVGQEEIKVRDVGC